MSYYGAEEYPVEFAARVRACPPELDAGKRGPLDRPPNDYPIFIIEGGPCGVNVNPHKWVAIAGALEDGDLSNGGEWFSNRIIHVASGVLGDDEDREAFWRDPPPYIAVGSTPDVAVSLLYVLLQRAHETVPQPLWYLLPGDLRWREAAENKETGGGAVGPAAMDEQGPSLRHERLSPRLDPTEGHA